MTRIAIDVPSMYADHHVTEARRVLLDIPGVKEVYASSAFHVVEVEFDPKKVKEEALREALDGMGYLNPLPTPVEPGVAMTENGGRLFVRHTTAYAQSGQSVSFMQGVNAPDAAWACPGMGTLTTRREN